MTFHVNTKHNVTGPNSYELVLAKTALSNKYVCIAIKKTHSSKNFNWGYYISRGLYFHQIVSLTTWGTGLGLASSVITHVI